MNSTSLCSLAGQYDNPIPTRFLAPIDSLKISSSDISPKYKIGDISQKSGQHTIARQKNIQKNRFQGNDSASPCNLVGWYDNPILTRFLASIDCRKIPAQPFQGMYPKFVVSYIQRIPQCGVELLHAGIGL
jgi:hypothetical protein